MEVVEGEGKENSVDLISSLPRDNRWRPFCQYRGFWLPERWLKATLAMRRRLLTRPDDIFVATCPKSGTTWLKSLVFSLANRGRHLPSDPTHPLRGASPHDCVPFLEEVFTADPDPDLDALPPPRIWSVHTPYSLLPASIRDSGCRVVYVTRDPKDVFVSLVHFRREVRHSAGTPLDMDALFESFCSGVSPYGPVWEHALEYWNESLRRPGKVQVVGYEEMKGDPPGSLKKLAAFLGCPFSAEEEREGLVEEISELCSFQRLSGLDVNKNGVLEKHKSRPFGRKWFFRRGEVGDWRNHLTSGQAEILDRITEEKLRGTGLKLS